MEKISLDKIAARAEYLRKVSTPLSALATGINTANAVGGGGQVLLSPFAMERGDIGTSMLLGGLGSLAGLRLGAAGRRQALRKYKALRSLGRSGNPVAAARAKAMREEVNNEAARRGFGGVVGSALGGLTGGLAGLGIDAARA